MKHPFRITTNGKLVKRRFNVIDRAVQKARQEIMAQEDAAIFKAMDSIFDIRFADSGNKEE
jgi:hypothetical protein